MGTSEAPDAHSPTGLVLYVGDKNLSSWSLRAWLVLESFGIEYEERLVRLEIENSKATLATVSPSARVPVLHHRAAHTDGTDLVIWDSLSIAEYLAELFPGHDLWPADRAVRATARSACAEIHSQFEDLREELPMDIVSRVASRKLSPETLVQVQRLEDLVGVLRSRFGATGPFVFGRFTIADAFFAPVLTRFRTYAVPVCRETGAYMEAVFALASMKRWEDAAAQEVATARG